MVTLLNSGQTGVERGAYQAAVAHGLAIGGFMTSRARDEIGPVPRELAGSLLACTRSGPRVAQAVNVEMSSTVVIAVPDAKHASTFTAMKQILQCVRAWRIPFVVVDPTTDLEVAASEILVAPEQVYITGPRATRWAAGASLGRRLVLSILAHPHV
jgi:hypothetical protein